MRTMKTLKVYEWLLHNYFITPATAMVREFNLMGDLTHEQVKEFLTSYFRRPLYIFRQMECDVTTTLHLETP